MSEHELTQRIAALERDVETLKAIVQYLADQIACMARETAGAR